MVIIVTITIIITTKTIIITTTTKVIVKQRTGKCNYIYLMAITIV